MAQFPEVDPETLAQAIRTYVAARMNVPALQNGGAPNYIDVLRGWAEAITATQNPSNAYFNQNDQTLFALAQQGGGQGGFLLFTAAVPLTIGQWVYQISQDTVALADRNSPLTGPALGVVVGNPTPTTVFVRDAGSHVYSQGDPYGFLPLTPDTIYYVGNGGNITTDANPPQGGYLQEIGYSKNTLQLVLNIQDPTLV